MCYQLLHHGFCVWSFRRFRSNSMYTLVLIIGNNTQTLIILSYLLVERRLELRSCRWSPFLLSDQERDLECRVYEIKFCQKIADLNQKENRKSTFTPIYLLRVWLSFLFFRFPMEKTFWNVDFFKKRSSNLQVYSVPVLSRKQSNVLKWPIPGILYDMIERHAARVRQ